jgi:hypothetical protein
VCVPPAAPFSFLCVSLPFFSVFSPPCTPHFSLAPSEFLLVVLFIHGALRCRFLLCPPPFFEGEEEELHQYFIPVFFFTLDFSVGPAS